MKFAALGRFVAPALLLFGALVHYAPGLAVSTFGGMLVAWETIAFSAETAGLWLLAAYTAPKILSHPVAVGTVRIVAAWYATQNLMRGACRPFFDMAHPLHLEQPTCVVALGEWIGWADIAATAATAAVVAQGISRGRR